MLKENKMDKEKILKMDPIILLSMINMKLRDFYKDLDALCEDLSVDKNDLISRLESVGFEYNNELNQFK